MACFMCDLEVHTMKKHQEARNISCESIYYLGSENTTDIHRAHLCNFVTFLNFTFKTLIFPGNLILEHVELDNKASVTKSH